MKQALILKDLFDIAARQDELPWQPFHEGVDIYLLYRNGKERASPALLR